MKRAAVAAVLCAATTAFVVPSASRAVDPTALIARAPTLTSDVVVAGLTVPWDVGFAPDGTMVFTEKGGQLSAFIGGAKRVLAAPADVFANAEAGMMGLAVDPNFATNRVLHVCQGFTDGVITDIRVYRWEVAADWGSASRIGGPTVSGIPVTTGQHSGCRLRFDRDGLLWIGTGDAAAGTNPQDLSSLAGKVLRVVGDTGAPAPGNPFDTPVYTYGHRNVQGLALHPDTGQMYSGEHGTDRDDEVNLLVRGGNYGWDPVPGYNQNTPMTDRSKYPTAIPAIWSSGQPTIALSGLTFVTGSMWRGWNGALIGATLKGSHLHVFGLDPAGAVVLSETQALTNRGRLRSVTQGPDGFLYVTTSNGFGNDNILRVIPW